MADLEFSNTKSWAKEYPAEISAMAIEIVSSADECHELIEAVRVDQPYSEKFRIGDVPAWLSLYTNCTAVRSAVADLKSRLLAVANDVEPRDLIFLAENQLLDDSVWGAAFSRIEIVFFFRVVMPCILLYGKSPAELLKRAIVTSGPNWDAMEDLVRLDKLVVGHPGILEVLNYGSTRVRQQRSEALSAALRAEPPAITKRQLKYVLSAILINESAARGQRLSVRATVELFNSYARDNGYNGDPDLPIDTESVGRAVRRLMELWDSKSGADKEAMTIVRDSLVA